MKFFAAMVMTLGMAGGAQAASITLDTSSGKVNGARNVLVRETYYDVEFKDGSCNSLFLGCDPNKFAFLSDVIDNADRIVAGDAARALIEQVIAVQPDLDNDPSLMWGCEGLHCAILTPYYVFGEVWPQFPFTGYAVNTVAINIVGWGSPDSVGYGSALGPDEDTSPRGNLVYAVWSASPVPAPATLALMGLGLAGVVSCRRSTGKGAAR